MIIWSLIYTEFHQHGDIIIPIYVSPIATIWQATVWKCMLFGLQKVDTRSADHARETAPILDCEQLFLKQSKFYEVENSTTNPCWESNPQPMDCMSSALNTEPRECDTFQFIVRDTTIPSTWRHCHPNIYESRYNRLTRYSLDVWVDHCDDFIMGAMASQITSLTIVYSIVYLGTDQRKHQSSASLAIVRGIHRGPVNSSRKGPVTRKMFPFDDVIMHDKITVIQCHVYWKQKHFPGTGYCVAGLEPGDLYIIDKLQLS